MQIQLVSADGYPRWPTEVTNLHQRYADAPTARLRVLTRPAAVAAKLSAWVDRAAPRDLYDLWALATLGYLYDDALTLFSRLGPMTDATRTSFAHLPEARVWRTALGHQCRVAVSAREAADVVEGAIGRLR